MQIAVKADETALDIKDNHSPDPTIAKPDSEVNPEEEPPLAQ